jgi:hypothetical protein
VTVLSDHSALRYLFSTKELNDQLARHLDFLANFQVKIEYRPGSQQKINDYLSRAQQMRNRGQSAMSSMQDENR